MAPQVELSPQLFKRLQALAIPLVDTIETVIARAVDAYEAGPVNNPPSTPSARSEIDAPREFSATSPPDLTHTKVLSARLCGKEFEGSSANWNGLMHAAIREAKARLRTPEQVKRLVIVNCVAGKKEDEGYRFLPDVGISIQGQDANGAWKATLHIAKQLGCDVEVELIWRHKEDAAFPGVTGRLAFAGSR